ncbi:hypothetical protein IEQ34_021711 [Dendrobium chrysotoxum]|uniref:TF-B3 domain-containing protein n=1 Tax=Dendrobium chrysotoxum TaxID=161865 RepID=A0AAV7FN41_DENCH|nr:hypothetical protein IEQ34_021711 [Dendrobium chrysotoxum]
METPELVETAELVETPEFPLWAQSVAIANNADGLQFLTIKTIEDLDISMEHSRIELPFKSIDILRQYLTPREIKKVDNFDVEDEDYSASNARWLNKGLDVIVFIPNRIMELQLTGWDGFKYATNIKGPGLAIYHGDLKVGDNVAIWMFRGQYKKKKERLCFIFHKLS